MIIVIWGDSFYYNYWDYYNKITLNVPPNHCNNVSIFGKGHCVIHSIILIINRFYIYIFL